MRRSALLAAVIGLAAAISGVWVYHAWAPSKPPLESTLDVFFPDEAGTLHTLTEWEGRVLVVNFWATWCAPCREEMPEFSRLQSEFAPQGLQFIGIAIDEGEAVRDYLQETPVNYPILLGEAGGAEWVSRLGTRLEVLPLSIVLDQRGNPVYSHAGVFRRDDLLKIVTPLLQHSQGAK